MLVCDRCGSTEIQEMAWVDPNTNECVGGGASEWEDRWCISCEDHCDFITDWEFKQKHSKIQIVR